MILEGHIAGAGAAFIVYGMCGLFPLVVFAIALVAILHALFRAARARLAESTRGALSPGPAVLHGPVQYAAGENLAVRVEITQKGTALTAKDGWHTSWQEIERKVLTRPFYIQDVRGHRVRVEPPEDVAFVDALDETGPVSKDGLRVRAAGLDQGEEVYALGTLVNAPDPEAVGDYRSQAMRPVLRRGSRMFLSAEPLARRFLARAKWHSIFGVLALLATALMQLLAYDYHELQAFGRQEQATVVSMRTWTTKSKKAVVQHAALRVRLSDGLTQELEIEPDGIAGVSEGSHVQVVRAGSVVQPGVSPSVNFGLVPLSVVVLVVLGLFYGILTHQTRPWYDKPLHEDVAGAPVEIVPY